MSGIKTHGTDDSVDAFIGAITDKARREDCSTLLALMRRATGEAPRVWSSGLVGFGTYHYKSTSGQDGDWFPVGFASRKAAITVYLGTDLAPLNALRGLFLRAHQANVRLNAPKRMSVRHLPAIEGGASAAAT